MVYLGDLDDLLKSRARTVLVLLLEGAAQHLRRAPHALLRRACVLRAACGEFHTAVLPCTVQRRLRACSMFRPEDVQW